MSKTPLPSVSVFEAESMLQESMHLLKKPENLEPIKEKLVGDFWEDHWVRAPFEECMTFKQLSSIHFDTLIKKRSFDCDKMVALSHAIKKALSSKTAHAIPPTPPNISLHEPLAPIKGLPTIASALYTGLKQFAYGLPEGHALAVAAQKLFEGIDPLACTAAWLTVHYDTQCAARLTGVSTSEIVTLTKQSFKQIAALFQYTAPECYLHWTTALTGAGASSHYLFSPYLYAKNIPQEFVADLSLVFLRAIGAEPIVIQRKVLPGHFSFSPHTAPKILSALKIPKKAPLGAIRNILSLPFPYFDIEELAGVAQPSSPRKLRSPKRAPKGKKR